MKSAKRKIVGRSKKAGGYEYGGETSYHRYYKIGISNSIGNSFCSIDSKEKEFERLDKVRKSRRRYPRYREGLWGQRKCTRALDKGSLNTPPNYHLDQVQTNGSKWLFTSAEFPGGCPRRNHNQSASPENGLYRRVTASSRQPRGAGSGYFGYPEQRTRQWASTRFRRIQLGISPAYGANEYTDKHGIKSFAVVSNNISLALPTAPFIKAWYQQTR